MRVFHKKSFVTRYATLVAIVGLLAPSVVPIEALSRPKISVPSASDTASDLERRYHIDPEGIKDQGETLNVSDSKKLTPEVSIFFSPSDPKEGEKMSARAFPVYFISETKQMYFTWYLQRSACVKSNSISSSNRFCDLDGNGRINEEDWKIEAARNIASNGFDWEFEPYTSETDADGYSARFGGDNRVNMPNYCYYHDNENGENYEIVGDAGEPDFGCSAGKEPVCMEGVQEVDPEDVSNTNTPLARDLELYYQFDDGTGETASDTSVNESDGTLTNGPVWTSGNINGGLDFDGADDYVVTSDAATLDIDNEANFTVAGWFNRDTFTADHTIVAKSDGQSAVENGYLVYIDDATDRLVFKASDGTDQYTVQSTSTFTSTGWNHFALVWNDTSGATLYINGSAEAGTTSGTFTDIGSLANAEQFVVGAESDQANPFDGKLDEIRLYSRALTSGEITSLDALTEPTEVSNPVSSSEATVTGFPYCSSSGTVACINGTPCCVSNTSTATACEQNITGGTCSVETSGSSDPVCRHLFPRAPGFTSGDGSFGLAEERFWQTDPKDNNTSDNGNKDEANVVGLGQESFNWNYSKGDKVGVVVEGTSMIATKHADSSNMIMWAFSKNRCLEGGARGSYQKNIKGYDVNIPTIEIDLNDCLEGNLVDPLEGGQATNLEVALQATPDDPLNDSSTQNTGDIVEVSASINNAARGIQNTFFRWEVDISPNGTINPPSWRNITGSLNGLPGGRNLLSQSRGNGVDRLRLALNIKDDDRFGTNTFEDFIPNGIGYLRFRLEVAENFNAAGANRRGREDIVIKFVSSGDRIAAYIVDVEGDPARLKLRAGENAEICSGVVDPSITDPTLRKEREVLARLDTKMCRVVKNEIIGLKLIGTNLSNFRWSINDLPLVCNNQVGVSDPLVGCPGTDTQGPVNFFPVIGNVGDIFTVTATANEIRFGEPGGSTTDSSEKVVTVSRSFKIVEPEVSIVSANEDAAWPKVLGQYVDAEGGTYADKSKLTLQAFPGSVVTLEALFTPDFLRSYAPPLTERSWTVDGEPVGDGTSNVITFSTLKEPGSIYNIGLSAVNRPRPDIRKALQDIWKISTLDSTEMYFASSVQLEHPESLEIGKAGVNKYLALVSSYLPAPLLFSIRVFLSAGLILFVTGFLFALVPNAPAVPGRWQGRRE